MYVVVSIYEYFRLHYGYQVACLYKHSQSAMSPSPCLPGNSTRGGRRAFPTTSYLSDGSILRQLLSVDIDSLPARGTGS